MKYYLIAGEPSGDLHASNLMAALKEEDREAEFRFFGGDKMLAVGGTLVKHYRDLAYMGIIPVIMHARTILKNMAMCKADIMKWQPDVVILVDYPGFNLDIAKYLHRMRGDAKSPKVFYYIAPKIWAWKEYRIKAIRRDVDEMFSILPFEVKWFADRDYQIHYVGNPCVDALEPYISKYDAARVENSRQIAILSGSRKQEISDNLAIMLNAASTFRDYKLVIAGAPNIDEAYYRKFIPEGVDVKIEFGKTYDILLNSVAALVTSGTATLETAILRVPQVVCYNMAMRRVMTLIRPFLIKCPYISLVNLVADKPIVEELILNRMTVDNVRTYLSRILPGGSDRQTMLDDYDEMNKILGGPGASVRAAREIRLKARG